MSDPSPSLINWMAPRHSACLVSYCPDVPTGCVSQERNLTTKTTKRKERTRKNQNHRPHPLFCGGPSSLVRPPSPLRLVSRSSAEQLMLQHASIALVETECNAGQGLLASCNSQRACAHRSQLRSVWLNSDPLAWPSAIWRLATCLLSVCRDRCIRRAQFPRSPLITNVGGCGGQSSGHAPPRRLVPDWPPSACVNLKPIESNLSLSFETAAPTTARRDKELPHLDAHCVVTHVHTHTHSGSIQAWPYQVASSGPRSTHTATFGTSDAYGDAAS